MYGGRIGDSTIAPDLVRDEVVVFASPAFAFWQRDNLRRYSAARAIVLATLDLGAPAAYRGRRETYWDSTGSGGVGPLSTELGDLAESVNARPEHGFTLDYQFDRDGDPTNAYCRSDHYMYARYGIPMTFFSAAAWYIDYHMVSDEPQYVAFDRMTRIGRYIRDYVGSVASLDHRPVVYKPKPDPNGLCRQ